MTVELKIGLHSLQNSRSKTTASPPWHVGSTFRALYRFHQGLQLLADASFQYHRHWYWCSLLQSAFRHSEQVLERRLIARYPSHTGTVRVRLCMRNSSKKPRMDSPQGRASSLDFPFLNPRKMMRMQRVIRSLRLRVRLRV
jgi:hypothetical protein